MTIRNRPSPALQTKIAHMKLKLAPIYPLPAGPPHSSFPSTLLQYWLLTEQEIDSMAAYYHQTSPNPWTCQYPANMRWDSHFLAKSDPLAMSKKEITHLLTDEERLGVKRRMLGKFIGLRGWDTPTAEVKRKLRFLEDRLERNILRERDMMTRKFP